MLPCHTSLNPPCATRPGPFPLNRVVDFYPQNRHGNDVHYFNCYPEAGSVIFSMQWSRAQRFKIYIYAVEYYADIRKKEVMYIYMDGIL